MAASHRSAARVTAALALVAAISFGSSTSAQTTGTLLSPPPAKSAPAAPVPADLKPSLPTGPSAAAAQSPAAKSAPVYTGDSRGGLKVSKGAGVLPNEHGQIWREYDLSPYTLHVRDATRPEQAVVDWILRETGTEVWFSEPLGILSATSTTLRVYHTPEMQERVRGIVERFVGVSADPQPLGLKLMTVGSPSWRARAVSLLKPVDVKSPGVEAWLLSRENAALLYDQLKARGDFREHSAPKVEVANGQTQALARTQ